jgi:TRAP-type C4-dicarboxylate transport system permease small subunit
MSDQSSSGAPAPGLAKRGALVSVRVDTSSQPRKPHHDVPESWPLVVRALAAVSRFFAVLEGIGIGTCLLAVIGLATWQFIERNLTQHHLPFFRVPPWTDGVIRHSVFMLGFLGGAYATYTGRHIRIDAVTRVIPPRRRMLLRVFTTTAAMIVVSFITRAAFKFYKVTLMESNDASQAMELFTPARGAMIMVIGYGVVVMHFFVQTVIDIGWLVSKQDPPAEGVAEAAHGVELPSEDSAVIDAHDPQHGHPSENEP